MKLYLIKFIIPVIILILGFYVWNSNLFFENIGYYYLPLSFGLIVGIFNFKVNRFKNKLLQLFSVVAISFILFYLNLLISLYLPKLFELNESYTFTFFKIIVFTISPLTVLISYFWFYKIKTSLEIIISSILAAVIAYLYSNLELVSYSIDTDYLFNSYLVWQIIVLLTLQFVIYKKYLVDFK